MKREAGMIQVWGRATSSNVQAVMWTLAELGLDARRHDRGHVHGGLQTPEFRAMNPHGLIPVLQDGDDAPIWESAAIVRYLAARYGDGSFWPENAAERARQDMWAEWVKTTLGPLFTHGVFWPLVRTPAAQRDEAAIAASVERVGREMLTLDARLAAGGDHLGGASPSFADMIAGHLLFRYHDVDIARPDAPALADYYARLCARPAYREHVMVDYSSLRASD